MLERKAKEKVKRDLVQKVEKGGSMPMEIGQVHHEEWPADESADMSFSFGSGNAGQVGWIGEVTKGNAQIEEVGKCESGWEKVSLKVDSGAIDTVIPPARERHSRSRRLKCRGLVKRIEQQTDRQSLHMENASCQDTLMNGIHSVLKHKLLGSSHPWDPSCT